ncbi:Crp/Fnr family transcriptional regulator [Lutibacter sp. TH_r2]|uniref:Crp/Fnr family transcriptional regulator n=1 Tax=Lutibacter sp. TH_r2 TaxID=3082083 RepID=UPI0029537199|nr:Crp/Fnr family transcriptional regulator [Lutibacter sp. TH_r2]MDV7188291.1 Crp/Fnr family transcriptional regulator [Lutibacter sp. TH_r2]
MSSEKLLKNNASFYKACFDSMQVGILIFNKKGEIIINNNPINSIFGFNLHQNISIFDLFDNVSVIKEYIINPTSKKFLKPIELKGITTKLQKTLEVVFGKINFEEQEYYKLLVTDISDRKEKETKIINRNAILEKRIKLQNSELDKIISQLNNSINLETKLLESVQYLLNNKEEESDFSDYFINQSKKSDLTTKVIDEFLATKNVFHYKKGEAIFCQGNKSNFIFLVKKGAVKVFKLSELGKSLTTRLYTKNSFFGYMSFIREQSHSQNAEALTNVELYKIQKREIIILLQKNPKIVNVILNIIANDLAETKDLLLTFAYGSVRQKVAKILLKLFNNKELVSNNKITISRVDLANYAGIAKETLIRTLHDFKEENLLKLTAKNIEILNPIKLQKI